MFNRLFLLVFVLIGFSAQAEPEADSEAATLIEELGLRAAAEPMARPAGWKPGKVLVTAPPMLVQVTPNYLQKLRSVAGDVELVIDDSGAFVPDVKLLDGVDAVIGLCHPGTVAAAPD